MGKFFLEFLIIAKFFFAIPAHSLMPTVSRVFRDAKIMDKREKQAAA